MDLFPRNYRRAFFGDTLYNESWKLELTFGQTGMDCLARTLPLAACHLKYWGLISFLQMLHVYKGLHTTRDNDSNSQPQTALTLTSTQKKQILCQSFFGSVNVGWHEGNFRVSSLEVNHKRKKTNLNSGNQQKVSLHLQNPVFICSLAWGAFCCNYQ